MPALKFTFSSTGDQTWVLYHADEPKWSGVFSQTIVAGVNTNDKVDSLRLFLENYSCDYRDKESCTTKTITPTVFSYPQENPPDDQVYFVPTEGAPMKPTRRFEAFRDTEVWYMVDTHTFVTQEYMATVIPACMRPAFYSETAATSDTMKPK
jgi:hypothetical protein